MITLLPWARRKAACPIWTSGGQAERRRKPLRLFLLIVNSQDFCRFSKLDPLYLIQTRFLEMQTERQIGVCGECHMIGLGTIINSAAIIAGGLIGHFTSKLFRQDQQDAVNKACGISVLFIAIAGAMQGMLHIDNGTILSGRSMLVVLCLALGTIIGEIIGIEKGFEHFGEWLKVKTGNSGDKQFVNAFVTASLTVCIGAMAIVGAMQDGISGDYSTLAVKAVLDFIIITVMTSSLGKGCMFSAIPVFLFEGAITVFARIISPVMTETAVAYLSLIGAVLIFCVGLNLVWGKKVRVANMLPAVIFAVLFAYLPWTF